MARTAAQTRYVEKNRERLNRETRERRNTPEHKAAASKYNASQRNQQNNARGWRLLKWNARRSRTNVEHGSVNIVSLSQLRNPSFHTVGLGYRRREFLFDPLPGAHPICANFSPSRSVENTKRKLHETSV